MSKSAAERQRDSRQRKRDSVTPKNVTLVTKPEHIEPDAPATTRVMFLPKPNPLAAVSDIDLQLKLKCYQGASWVGSPEHREVVRRRKVAVAV